MIKTSHQLKEILKLDYPYYHRKSKKDLMLDILFSREEICIWNYIKNMRYCDYYTTNKHKSLFHAFMYWWHLRKHNRNSVKLGLIIGAGAFGAGLCIYHTGNIVVNGYSKIGKNCKLHGSNCIGNSHCEDDCPTIGDNVRLGVGAKVFGKIYIANNVTIAAGAVVTKSCYEEGVTLAGVPAKIIKYEIKHEA